MQKKGQSSPKAMDHVGRKKIFFNHSLEKMCSRILKVTHIIAHGMKYQVDDNLKYTEQCSPTFESV